MSGGWGLMGSAVDCLAWRFPLRASMKRGKSPPFAQPGQAFASSMPHTSQSRSFPIPKAQSDPDFSVGDH
jgi:hypothetical protein